MPLPDEGCSHGIAQVSCSVLEVAPVQDQDSLPANSLLAALELIGVEQAYLLDEASTLSFLQEFRPETGRLLLLGERPFAQSLVLHAHFTGLACRSFLQPPRYWSDRLGRIMTLDFTAGRIFSSQKEEVPEQGQEHSNTRVRLDATHENLWIWPDLDPDWFRSRRVHLFSA